MPLDQAYFMWLYSQVGSVENRNLTKTYWKLLEILYQTEFTWREIENDANRAQDGKDFRREFLAESQRELSKADEHWMDMGCSFLELLISISWKLEFQGGETLGYWFWQLIENMGLIECTDASEIDETIVKHIITRVIERDYSPNGAGGLFPLTHTDKDQREVELWYQAEAYLLERL